jgi:hypothetical protein
MPDALHDRLSLRHPHHLDEELFNSAVSWRAWSGMPFWPDDEWPKFKTSAAGFGFSDIFQCLWCNQKLGILVLNTFLHNILHKFA